MNRSYRRTVPTAAALLMIATGITLAQSAEDAMQPAESSQVQPAAESEPQTERTREHRREMREKRDHHADHRAGDHGSRGHAGPAGKRRGPGGPDGMEARRGPGGPGGPEPGPQGRAGEEMQMLFRDVNLTEDQHDQVRQLVKDATTPMQAYMANHAAELRQARDAMQQARQDRDREAGQAAGEQLKALRDAGPKVDREALAAEIRALLNASQQEVFDANLEQAKARRAEMQAKREQRMQQRNEPGEPGERPQRRQREARPEGDGPPPPPRGDQLEL